MLERKCNWSVKRTEDIPSPFAHKNACYSVNITILCLGLSLRSETFPGRAPCWRVVVGGSFFFLAPKAPQEEVRAHKWKGILTVLSGDKSDGHMSGYCLVVVYSCTYSLDKFHCQWYKTPNGTGILKEKQESILTCVWNTVVLPRRDPKVVQNSHLHPSTCKKIRCSSWPVTVWMNDAYPQYLSP